MKQLFIIISFFALVLPYPSYSQEEVAPSLKISGHLLSDQRFLLNEDMDWAWNETRVSLNLDKKWSGKSKFSSEIWLRNIGLPAISQTADLYNKGIVDPYNLELRSAYFQVYGFLFDKLDLSIGRQRISWGRADQLNPTDNLNPYDMEDILDFGRHRGSDAIRLVYYLNHSCSLEGVWIPFFQPANLPIGIFANALNPGLDLPQGLTLNQVSDQIILPRYKLSEGSVPALKIQGFAAGMDFSLSYVYGLDGIPFNAQNTFIPIDALGGIDIESTLTYLRMHIFGADLATNLWGIGLWAEAALFLVEEDAVMSTDLSALYPMSPDPVIQDSVFIQKDEPYLKLIVGGDYFFPDGSYANLQYMHGFIHERGRDALNDYFFMRWEKKFFNEKLKIAPLSGAFIVSDWNDVKNNYALVYMPEISYCPRENTELILAAVLFKGSGDNLFAQLGDYNMLKLGARYSF